VRERERGREMKDSLFLVARTDTKLSTESIVDAGRKTDKERKRERERERD